MFDNKYNGRKDMKNYFNHIKSVYSLTSIVFIGSIITLVLIWVGDNISVQGIWRNNSYSLNIALAVCIAVGIICGCIHMGIVSLLNNPLAVEFDMVLLIIVLSSIEYTIIQYCINGICFNSCASIYITMWAINIVIYRLVGCSENQFDSNSINEFGLKEIYDNTFEVKNGYPITISDEVACYDLLNRTRLLESIVQSIITSDSKGAYVIGIEGDWGSGKTTFTNMLNSRLSERKEVVIINGFDLWMSGNKESIISTMYSLIIQSLGIRNTKAKTKMRIRKLVATVSNAGLQTGMIASIFRNDSNAYTETIEIKKELDNIIEKSKKKYVFFIDNLDRIDADSIMFIFKVLGTIFNLPSMKYVISYDPKRLTEILDKQNHINPKYLEKIIQQKVVLPKISRNLKKDIICKSSVNIIEKYRGEKVGTEYDAILYTICQEVDNLRQFKRLINSGFVNAFTVNKMLNNIDMLSVEVILFFEPQLYELIYSNKQYFIAHDYQVDGDFKYIRHISGEKFDEIEKFYDELFKKYPKYEKLLAKMFVCVEAARYSSLTEEYLDMMKIDVVKDKSINSAMFFDSYFSYCNNEYVNKNNEIREWIKQVNESKCEKDAKELINNKIDEIIKSKDQEEYLDQLALFCESIEQSNQHYFADALFKRMYAFYSVLQSSKTNAKQKAMSIIICLLENCDTSQFKLFCDDNSSYYKSLWAMWNIHKHFEEIRYNSEPDGYIKYESISKLFDRACKDILESEIDLYNNEYYCRGNIWALLDYCTDKKCIDLGVFYLKKNYRMNSVYRYIGDAITMAMSEGFWYSIENPIEERVHISDYWIEKSIEKYPPETDSERFVCDLFMKYKNNGSKGYIDMVDEPISPLIWLEL